MKCLSSLQFAPPPPATGRLGQIHAGSSTARGDARPAPQLAPAATTGAQHLGHVGIGEWLIRSKRREAVDLQKLLNVVGAGLNTAEAIHHPLLSIA